MKIIGLMVALALPEYEAKHGEIHAIKRQALV